MCVCDLYYRSIIVVFFLFNETATTEIYTYGHTLSLHDALPICASWEMVMVPAASSPRIEAPAPCRNQLSALRGVGDSTIASCTTISAAGTVPSGPVIAWVARRARAQRSQRPRS